MAKSRYREIGDAILAEISSVPGAGRVHAYQRWSADLGKYLDLFRWETGGGLARIRGVGADAREGRRRGCIARFERQPAVSSRRASAKEPTRSCCSAS